MSATATLEALEKVEFTEPVQSVQVDPVQAPESTERTGTPRKNIPNAFDGGDDLPSPYVDPKEFDWEMPQDDDETRPVSAAETKRDALHETHDASSQSSDQPQTATETPVATTTAPQPNEHAELHEQAKLLGLDPKVFGTPEQLEVAVRAIDLKLAELGRQGPEATQSPPQAPPVKQPAPAQQPVKAETAKTDEELQLELDEELSDPAVVKAVSRLREHYDKKLEALTGQLQSFQSFQQQAQIERLQQAEARWFDGFEQLVAADAGDLGDVLGKGTRRELAADSAEMKNRVEILDQMNALLQGYGASGLPIPPQKALYAKAKSIVLADQLTQRAVKRGADQARDQSGKFTARPTQRQGRPGSPIEKAVSGVRNFFAERGIETGPDVAGMDDEI